MLAANDFVRMMNESKANDAPLSEMIEAWGINVEDFKTVIVAYADAQVEAIATDDRSLTEAIRLSFWCGFELGYKAALEIEMQRMSNE